MSGNEKGRQNGQSCSQCQRTKFTYSLEMRRKTDGQRNGQNQNQQVHILSTNERGRQNGQMHGQSQINKYTYMLEMKRQDRMVRSMVRAKSTSSHTSWK